MNILVVEDDKYTAEALKIALLEASHTVEIATENILVWERLNCSEYNLILLDARLAALDSFVACRKLREKGCYIPILLMLDSYNEQDIKNSLWAGVDDCITKPFNLQDLIIQIDSLANKEREFHFNDYSLTWDSLTLNFKYQYLVYNANQINLETEELYILELFFRGRNRVFSYNNIIEMIGCFSSGVTKQTINNSIVALNTKLAALGFEDLIEGVYGSGYRLKHGSVNNSIVDYRCFPKYTKLMPQLWIISTDRKFFSSISAEASRWGIKTQLIDTLVSVNHIPNDINNVILLDVNIWDNTEALRTLLAEVYIDKSLVSLIAVLSGEDIKERLMLGDFCPQAVCRRSASPTQILDIIAQNAKQLQIPECKLLLIEDNQDTLSQLRRLLEPWGFIIVALENDLRFWETIKLFKPELLVLGDYRSGESPFNLCELLRNSSQWSNLSIILLLSDSTDLLIHKVFDVGADDFVLKPIVGPELVNRLLKCWEKVRSDRRSTQSYGLLQVTEPYKSNKELDKLLHLARRQNQNLSLVVLQIKNFSKIQKLFGHFSINNVLQSLSDFLHESLRTEDVVVCWGEEFLVSMYGINKTDAFERFNHILVNIRTQQFIASDGTKFTIDCGMGISQYPQDGTNINLLYEFTKKNLY